MERKIKNVAFLAAGLLSLISTSNGQNYSDGQGGVSNGHIFDQNLKPYYMLLTGGHSLNPAPSAQAMLLEPTMPVFHNITLQIMKEAKQGLQSLFQTESPYVAAMAGTGRIACETAFDNMIEPGDVVLAVVNGFWSQRFVQIPKRLGAIVKTIEKEAGNAFDVEEIKNEIQSLLPKIVFIVMGESLSGLTQDIQGIGDLCIQLNCYLIVDVVSIVGVQPVNFDALKIDVAFCNSQKGTGSIVGMAPIVYSPRAIAMAKNRKIPPASLDRDVSRWVDENYWFMNEEPDRNQYPVYQFPVVQIYALREGLRLLSEEGYESVWKRHEVVHNYFSSKLASELPQLRNVINEKERLIGTFILAVPDESRLNEIISEMETRHSIHIAHGGGSPTLANALRVSIFGPTAQKEVVDKIISALKDVLN